MRVDYSIGVKFGGGGIGYIASCFAGEIYARGFLKRIFATSRSETEIAARVFKIHPYVETLPKIFRIPNRFIPLSRWYLWKDHIFDRWVSKRIGECDVFHGWTCQSLYSLRAARRKGAVTFLEHPTAHVLTQKRLLQEEYQRFNIKGDPIDPGVIKRRLAEYKETDFIIVTSRFVYDSFIAEGADQEKLILIPYGVDTDTFKPSQKIYTGGAFRIAFVGQIGIRKGLIYLLRAFSELKIRDSELVIAGWVNRDMKEVLKEYSRHPRIIFLRFMPQPQEIYRDASLCVFPSVEDGFGLVVLEAFASGKPVIVSENTGAKDAVSHNEDGFIVPAGDVEALKERILYCYEHQDKLKTMGEKALQKAKDYSWTSSVRKLIDAYKRALSR